MAIEAAAPPPTALNRLTSWGMSVIFTVRGRTTPKDAPSSTPATRAIHPQALPPVSTRAYTTVDVTAMTIPTAET